MEVVSNKCRDHFDFVIKDNYIYNLPNSPDRWPDEGNGGDEPDDPPPTKRVSTKSVFIATQPEIAAYTAQRYAESLKEGADMPPVAAIKCKGGVIVWNGHHRLTAHRLAGMKTVKVRFWGEIDKCVEELVKEAGEE